MYDFRKSYQDARIAERIAVIALLKQAPGINAIKLIECNGPNSVDIRTTSFMEGDSRIDFKCDSYAYKTGNLLWEVISQWKPKHFEKFKEKDSQKYTYGKTVFEKKNARRETLWILNSIKEHLINNGSLDKSFSVNELGWGIKNIKGHNVIFFTFDNMRNILSKSETKSKVFQFYQDIYCSFQDIGPEQCKAIRIKHDTIFNQFGIKEYKMWRVSKEDMYQFVLNANINNAINVPNYKYKTLSFLVKSVQIENLPWCITTSWKG